MFYWFLKTVVLGPILKLLFRPWVEGAEHIPGVKGRLTAWFFKGVGQIPIDRSGGRASEAAISSGLKVLRKDELFGIYPEGTRSPDGRLYRGRTGVAHLALCGGVDGVAAFGAARPSS